jgi:hypothetical protein
LTELLLRELFDDLVAAEPPLTTTAETTADAGRRLRRRSRTLWILAGAASMALAVATVAMLPRVWTTEHAVEPMAPLTLTAFLVCPKPAAAAQPDGSRLPRPAAAEAAAMSAGPRIQPGMQFIVRQASIGHDGTPRLELTLDAGDAAGWGSLGFEIFPEYDIPAADRAERGANVASCVEGSRHDFADGSVAIHYPYGPPEQEATVTHVWYYAEAGFTMNIGMFPHPQRTQPTLPARGVMPLRVDQVMQLAHAIAQSAGGATR